MMQHRKVRPIIRAVSHTGKERHDRARIYSDRFSLRNGVGGQGGRSNAASAVCGRPRVPAGSIGVSTSSRARRRREVPDPQCPLARLRNENRQGDGDSPPGTEPSCNLFLAGCLHHAEGRLGGATARVKVAQQRHAAYRRYALQSVRYRIPSSRYDGLQCDGDGHRAPQAAPRDLQHDIVVQGQMAAHGSPIDGLHPYRTLPPGREGQRTSEFEEC